MLTPFWSNQKFIDLQSVHVPNPSVPASLLESCTRSLQDITEDLSPKKMRPQVHLLIRRNIK